MLTQVSTLPSTSTQQPAATSTPSLDSTRSDLSEGLTNWDLQRAENSGQISRQDSQTVEASIFLESRRPTLATLNMYLENVDDETLMFGNPLSESAQFTYLDLNGDLEDDLIVTEHLRLFVLLWNRDKYTKPFHIQYDQWKYDPATRIDFDDWTKDGIPEVIFDSYHDGGGTGFYEGGWFRDIIHCEATHCRSVLRKMIGSRTQNTNAGGMSLSTATLVQDRSVFTPTIRSISNQFWIYDPQVPSSEVGFSEASRWLESSASPTSTLSIYVWSGSIFELTEQQIVSLPSYTPRHEQKSAVNPTGSVAAIKTTKVVSSINRNDRCQLIVDGIAASDLFGCKENFVTVEWRNVVGNETPEILVKALSGKNDPEGLIETKTDCFHQRLLLYIWDGSTATEIANISGCLVDKSLEGVQLEDYDGDGQEELIANTWERNQACLNDPARHHNLFDTCFDDLAYARVVYIWNGSQFVYWDKVPGINYTRYE